MTFLSHLQWRNATKSFDPEKKVSESDVQKIQQAIQMTPSSFGLQTYHLYVITNQDLKDKIQKVAWDQPQMGTCSHLLVFCSRNDVSERIHQYVEIASGGDAAKKEALSEYRGMMEGALLSRSPEALTQWAQKQAYIALGFAMAACAEMEVDSCPVEGADFSAVDEIINVPSHLQSCVMLPIGYRDMEPRGKVRFPEDDLFTKVS